MALRLSTLSPHLLSVPLVQNLRDINVRTATDLILSSSTDLISRLPPGTISLLDLRRCIELVTEQFAVGSVSAQNIHEAIMLEDELRDGMEVRSGVAALDALLGGGFGGYGSEEGDLSSLAGVAGGGRVIEISGDGGAGKTTLALHLIFRHLTQHERTSALFIDTVGDLSPERVVSLAGQADCMEPGSKTVLERLQITIAFDLDAAYNVLENLRAVITADPSATPRCRIVVIDTITSLLGPQLSAVSSQGHAAMTDFMRFLRSLAQSYGLCILVLNSATSAHGPNPSSSFSSTTKKPALGPSFVFMTDATLWLSSLPPELASDEKATQSTTSQTPLDVDGNETESRDRGELRVAEVFRSHVSPSKTWCTFRIKDGVILAS